MSEAQTAMHASLTSRDRVPAAQDDGHASATRLLVLDGWRAVSIFAVLWAHMLPGGPKSLELNNALALAGMSLFFTLSGFLITTNLSKHPNVGSFLVRRLCRILPLAYLGAVVYLLVQGKDWRFYLAHFVFIENYATSLLTTEAGHFWSLCVEVHFYIFVAMWVLWLGRRGLRLVPLLALVILALRVAAGARVSIYTHLRGDEILAGLTLALIWMDQLGNFGARLKQVLRVVPLWAWVILFTMSCLPIFGPWMYLRPYLGTAVIGHTLVTDKEGWGWLRNRFMRYVAEISYALYVIHPLSMHGWLGSGGTIVKYLKRPLCFAITFVLAHLSTFHMERHFIAWGKHMSRRVEGHQASPAAQTAPA
jgi:peptidoglycan/LPS O-acetylase OafA/YrhL